MEDLLTRISKVGSVVKVYRPNMNSQALAIHLTALRHQGHAVSVDEVFDSGGLSLGITVTHYLTCKRCKGEI